MAHYNDIHSLVTLAIREVTASTANEKGKGIEILENVFSRKVILSYCCWETQNPCQWSVHSMPRQPAWEAFMPRWTIGIPKRFAFHGCKNFAGELKFYLAQNPHKRCYHMILYILKCVHTKTNKTSR